MEVQQAIQADVMAVFSMMCESTWETNIGIPLVSDWQDALLMEACKLVTDNHSCVMLGVEDGIPVAMIACYMMQVTPAHEPSATFGYVYTKPKYRNQTPYRLMLQMLDEWLDTQNVNTIIHYGMRDLPNLYDRFGFREIAKMMMADRK